jgi:SulP family sulfate permease
MFDHFEYATILIITLVMTVAGMTAGLAFGVICACLTFTLQESNFITPVRGHMSARTLRSTQWRSQSAREILDNKMSHVRVFQLQGTLFFGNATSISKQIEALLLLADKEEQEVWVVVLDFTLVVSIDSSAADTIAKIVSVCQSHDVRLVYCRGSTAGFPTMFPLTDKISDNSIHGSGGDEEGVYMCDSLDDAMSWCEAAVIAKCTGNNGFSSVDHGIVDIMFAKKHLWQLYALCPYDDVDLLMMYFQTFHLAADTIIWRQGDLSDKALLLVSGELTSTLEEEAGTMEIIESGHLVGEYGIINGQRRLSTMQATKDSEVLVISSVGYEKLTEERPDLALILVKICVGYLGRRVQYVGNRVWESHCIPL